MTPFDISHRTSYSHSIVTLALDWKISIRRSADAFWKIFQYARLNLKLIVNSNKSQKNLNKSTENLSLNHYHLNTQFAYNSIIVTNSAINITILLKLV